MRIKRTLISFVVFINLSLVCFGQTEEGNNYFQISVSAGNVPYSIEEKNGLKIVDYPSFTDPTKAGEYKLPSKTLILAIPSNSNPSLKVINVEKKILDNAVPAINPKIVHLNDSTLVYKKYHEENNLVKINSKPVAELGKKFWFRDFYCIEIIVNNFQFDPAQNAITIYKNINLELSFSNNYQIQKQSPLKIKSKFDTELRELLYNSNIAEQFRKQPTDYKQTLSDSWINYSNDYIRISVAKDALFRISKRDLINLGISTDNINPQTFQLFESGSEQQIYVEGENDGVFDNNEYIEFWGTKNYARNDHREINADEKPYNTYLNIYTDTTYYFLTWGNTPGLRYKIDSSIISGNTSLLEYHKELLHVEENTMYQNLTNDEPGNQTSNWNRNKSWYWKWIFTNPVNFNITLADIYPNKTGNVYLKMTSAGSNISQDAHQVALRMNSIKMDSSNLDRFDQVLLSGPINSNNLINGRNVLRVHNYENGTVPNWFALDWYEIEYPKYNRLVNDSSIIVVPNKIKNEIVTIRLTNAGSDRYSIYKVNSKYKKILNYMVNSNSLQFIDTSSTNEKYAIFEETSVNTPIKKYIGRFKDLRSDHSQADYIALTSKIFAANVTNYLSQIENMYDLNTKEVLVEDIFNEFGYGYPTPESIKEFVQYAYNIWSTPSPSYLVLFGDATYDYKYYRFASIGEKISHNYIPAYGNPVSDNWYTMWGDGPPLPQLKVGRLPILSESELIHYQDKVQNNYNSDFSELNKRYILFSGGDADNSSELDRLKSANDSLIAHVIEPRPISGEYFHFYKTLNPESNIGPYTKKEYQTAIDKGAIFISYLGHSGTATWDNGINSIKQLENAVNGNPVISDFGCSTNKYAEPDIICFGERFILENNGQALGYIGNSSLGFLSTALSSPEFFYKSFLLDSLFEIGNAHLYLKSKLYELFGNSQVFKIFSLSNVILGDPAIRLKIPFIPNPAFINQPLLEELSNLSDGEDSVSISFIVTNFGSSPHKTYELLCNQYFEDKLISSDTLINVIPRFRDTLKTWIKTKSLTGEHKIEFILDPSNKLYELNENDNYYSQSFTVFSSALHDLLPYSKVNGNVKELNIISPSFKPSKNVEISTEISDESNFTKPISQTILSNSLVNKLDLSDLARSRYWFRYKINDHESQFSFPKSFFKGVDYNFSLVDSSSFNEQLFQSVKYDDSNLHLSIDTVNISVLSAGHFSGSTCLIEKNGTNLLENTSFTGLGIVVFDSASLGVDTAQTFRLWNNQEAKHELAVLINSIEPGKIVVLAVATEATHHVTQELKDAIYTIGSSKYDSLKFDGAWAIIGRKGASPGDPDILEVVDDPYTVVTLEKDYIIPSPSGYLTTTQLGPVSSWDSLYVDYSKPNGSSIKLTPIGINRDGSSDTLNTYDLFQKNTLLSERLPNNYPYAKLKFELQRNDQGESPAIREIGVSHQNAAELAINYQTAIISQDTVIVSDSIGLNFKISNVGEGTASNVRNKVDLYKNNMFVKTVFDSTLSSLNSESDQEIDFNYTTLLEDGVGNFKFVIELDADDNVVELYEDNNKFELPFVVKDTVTSISSAVVRANFDGYEIYDGDYVSHNPKIEILLDYEGRFEISDTNSIEILLNQKRISFANLNTSHEAQNNRIIFSFNPELEDGDYTISVLGDNIRPANSEKNTFVRFFKVSSESKILYPYNFPNPFANETHFTFKLTQIPYELKIKIFTIAGRLVREIKVNREELNFDFNRIFWDGRDEDGDLLANGVYLYKIISYDSDKTVSVTSKIAIVR